MSQRYIARQPIIDVDKHVFGYELLYRNSKENFFPKHVSSTEATQKLISSMQMDFDPKQISGGLSSFVNFPKDVILSDLILCIEPSNIIIEILEDIIVDKEFAHRVFELKQMGYTFAVDDFTGEQDIDEIISCISIIKVDFLLTGQEEQTAIINKYKNHATLLAEKIETVEQYDLAIQLGFQLFQGYYFSKPTLIVQETCNVLKSSLVSLWRELAKDMLDYNRIADIINGDVGITYRLLKTINTIQYETAARITSVKQALVYMGNVNARKWLTLIMMQHIADRNEEATIKIAMSRAFWVENITQKICLENNTYLCHYAYLRSLFSVLPKQSQVEITDMLNFSGKTEELDMVTETLTAIFAYENADWDIVSRFAKRYSVQVDELCNCYRSSVAYADELSTVRSC